MKIVSNFEDVAALRAAAQHPPALLDLAEARMRDVIAAFQDAGAEWTPEEHGAFVLVEAGDDVRDFRAVGLNPEDAGLVGALWEVATWHAAAKAYEVLVLYCGDTGWTFFVPDAPWVDAVLREKLRDETEDAPAPAAAAGPERAPF